MFFDVLLIKLMCIVSLQQIHMFSKLETGIINTILPCLVLTLPKFMMLYLMGFPFANEADSWKLISN